MTYRTLETVLAPDGKLSLGPADIPTHPVRVMVTVLEVDEDNRLAEVGDYHAALTEYEERLARGELRWQ